MKIFFAKKIVVFTLFFLSLASVHSAEVTSSISGKLDWENMIVDAKVRLDIKSLGSNPLSGRTVAEDALFSQYLDKIRPFILSIPVDSTTVLGNMIDSGELPAALVDDLALSARSIPPAYSEELKFLSSSYFINLKDVGSRLLSHKESAKMRKLITPVPTRNYTGILIIADSELPVHGRKTSAYLRPCLFPRIWDSNMNLIYDKTMMERSESGEPAIVHYTRTENIFKNTPSGLDSSTTSIVGDKPLRILANGIFGMNPTDPVISEDDALQIISSDANKNLLRRGRVVIVIQSSHLNSVLAVN